MDEGQYLAETDYSTCTSHNQNKSDYLISGKVSCLLACLNLALNPLNNVKFISDKGRRNVAKYSHSIVLSKSRVSFLLVFSSIMIAQTSINLYTQINI